MLQDLPLAWRVSTTPIPYEAALAFMHERVEKIWRDEAPEMVWLLEHPSIYTLGSSAPQEELLSERFPAYRTGRGGRATYHGPGQRVAYVMLNLNKRGRDVRRFVTTLEAWVIATLETFRVTGLTRPDRVGVWTPRLDKGPAAEDKIAAIGVRVRRWVTFHGVALNIAPNLEHFNGIVPCGITSSNYGVTSLKDLGITATYENVDAALKKTFLPLFGETPRASDVKVSDDKHS